MIKNFVRNNALYTIFVLSQLILFILALQKDDIIGDNYDISLALTLHFFVIVLFTVGYSFNKRIILSSKKIINKVSSFVSLKKGFFLVAVLLTIIGLITSILTIGSIISPQEYLSQLVAKDDSIAGVRQEAGDGGLGGVFKMLNYCPLGIYLITSSFLNFYKFDKITTKKLNRLNTFSLICSVIKVLFSLDRLTIMAILIVQIYTNLISKKISIKFLLIIGGIVILGGFITASRMSDSGFFDFLIVYFKLSLVNYQLVLNDQNDYAYGFQTFLSPLGFIAKFFGVGISSTEPKNWVWNPAQYFNSYLYMDFGFFSFLFYPFFGYFIRCVEILKKNGNRFYTGFYFILLFCITTFISVPFIRGMEFWLLIVVCLLLSKFVQLRNSGV
ncbi:hypothetical protein ASE92_15790 [Pedobacter sp. Leaf41]|uniref:oligosaccharide repeat unit polymerase n=1 Tax=Pedobacter sp. Leaf41 TaxID=1736218 RepID=UPI000702AFBB|nr:oligosaccharide repeat unit polymerase [Pedobacter sp. Leaf41]KQN34085.1 hypothetical protein ASE92_15790 [Pedobacter sp. Leaf41]